MGTLTLGLALTSLTQFKCQVKKKKGSTKLPLPNLQGIHPDCWLYIIQSNVIFMLFIYFLTSLFVITILFIYLYFM